MKRKTKPVDWQERLSFMERYDPPEIMEQAWDEPTFEGFLEATFEGRRQRLQELADQGDQTAIELLKQQQRVRKPLGKGAPGSLRLLRQIYFARRSK